jgi:predicted transposase/invertase (TIGR01784 family)
MAEGRAKGLAEGRAEGRAEGIIEVARKMKLHNMSTEDILQLTGLDPKTIADL